MKKNITIRDIAKAVQVSDTTVSWALKNHPLISKATKQKVLQCAKELGYIPNMSARNLRKSRTNIIGVVLNDILNPSYSKILKGIEFQAQKLGYNIFLSNTNWDARTERAIIDVLMQHNVAGIIATPTQKETDCYLRLIERRIPLVFIDTAIESVNANSVVPDTVLDGYLAAQYLIGLGHRRICHITGALKQAAFPSFVNIIKGFTDALAENNLTADRGMIRHGGLKIEDGFSTMRKILREKNMPTAVLTVNDLSAIGAMSAIDEAGLNVPDDISVIGIDNADFAALPRISLTTIAEPAVESGEKAVEILAKNIKANELNTKFQPQQLTLKPKLIVRNSCRKPRA